MVGLRGKHWIDEGVPFKVAWTKLRMEEEFAVRPKGRRAVYQLTSKWKYVRQPTQMKTRLQFRPKPSPWLPTKWRHRLLHHTKINQTHRRRRQYQVRRVLRLRHLPRVVIPENLQPSNQELLDVIILFTPRFMKEIGGSDAVLAGKLEEDMLRDFSAT
ncbi:hypothetical protein JG687_00013586, partial [Phytophthora cactorum]